MGIYKTKTSATSTEDKLILSSDSKDSITITPPPEFDGPEGFWTPEDLFSASISSCYLLTFKSMARFKKLEWISIDVSVEATLEKGDGALQFTQVSILPVLKICCQSSIDPYLELLEKAKKNCLVTKSMKCKFTVIPKIILKAKKSR